MKSCYRPFLCVIAVALVLSAMTVCFGSCYQTPSVIIENAQNITKTTVTTRPTVAVPATQLTLPFLLDIHGPVIPWSTLEPFDHTMISEDSAQFVVADTYGKECTLTVTIDRESGNLSEATVSYEDVSANLLSSSGLCLMPIYYALNDGTTTTVAAAATTTAV